MEYQKQWYQSSSILGSIVVLISLLASIFNYDINAQTQNDMVNTALAISGAIGSAIAIYGRIKATKTISSKPVMVEPVVIPDAPTEVTTPSVMELGATTETITPVAIPPAIQPVLDIAVQAYNQVVADNIQALSAQTK